MVPVDDIVSAFEIAERLEVSSSQVVRVWHQRGLLPEPITRVGNVWVWSWVDVERWARETGRL